tara:strand:- start:71 stop:286 length:216 start_codon:yes stop_codon:yes gene_type:complete
MDKKKLDRIISIIREEMMTANAPGGQGGFGGDAPAKGPRAGFDPVMGTTKRRKKKFIKLPPGSRKRWMKDK